MDSGAEPPVGQGGRPSRGKLCGAQHFCPPRPLVFLNIFFLTKVEFSPTTTTTTTQWTWDYSTTKWVEAAACSRHRHESTWEPSVLIAPWCSSCCCWEEEKKNNNNLYSFGSMTRRRRLNEDVLCNLDYNLTADTSGTLTFFYSWLYFNNTGVGYSWHVEREEGSIPMSILTFIICSLI